MLFTKGGHQETGGALRLFGHKTKRKADRDGDAGHHRPGRTEHRLLRRLGNDLGKTEFQVIMGLLQVTNGVHAVAHVDGLVRFHLDFLTLQQTVRLLGDHIGDTGFLGVEVVIQLVHLVALPVLGHFRKAFHFSGGKVFPASGVYRIGFHVVFQVIRRQFHVLISDRGAAVIIDHAFAVAEIRDDGVLGGREGRTLQRTLAKQVHGVGPGGFDGIGPVQGIPGGDKT